MLSREILSRLSRLNKLHSKLRIPRVLRNPVTTIRIYHARADDELSDYDKKSARIERPISLRISCDQLVCPSTSLLWSHAHAHGTRTFRDAQRRTPNAGRRLVDLTASGPRTLTADTRTRDAICDDVRFRPTRTGHVTRDTCREARGARREVRVAPSTRFPSFSLLARLSPSRLRPRHIVTPQSPHTIYRNTGLTRAILLSWKCYMEDIVSRVRGRLLNPSSFDIRGCRDPVA